MKRSAHILFFIFLLGVWSNLLAQNGNPFELQHRIKSTNVTLNIEKEDSSISIKKNIETTQPVQATKSSNPFDKTPSSLEKINNLKTNGIEETPLTAIVPTIKELKSNKREDFLFWILILDLLFLSIVINLNRSTLGSIFKAVRNDSFMSLLAKTSNTQTKLQYTLYFFLYIINVGLFLYISLKTLWGVQGIAWIFKSIGVVLGVYLIRYLGLSLLARVYPVQREVGVYRYTIIIFGTFIMFFIIAINFCLAFVPEDLVRPFIYAGIVLLGGSYILRQLRGLFIGINYISQSPSHFFLYLCTFEIAPFIIGYRFFESMG